MKRNLTIDIMKGMGIISVVVYHAIGNSVGTNGLYFTIISFAMALFLIISGYLSYPKLSDTKWLLARVIKFFIPVLVFTCIYWLCGTIFHIHSLPTSAPSNHLTIVEFGEFLAYNLTYGFSVTVLWYLWCLILCYAVFWGLEKLKKELNSIPFAVFVLIVIVAVNTLPIYVFGANYFKWWVIFYAIGYMMKRYSLPLLSKIFSKAVLASLVLFPLSVYLTRWMSPYESTGYLLAGMANIKGAILSGNGWLILLFFTMAILGVSFIYSLAFIMQRIKGVNKVFLYLGNASIAIYLIHIIFVCVFKNYIYDVILAIGVSLVVYEIFKRIKITNLLLFGGTNIPQQWANKLCGTEAVI